MALRPFAVVPSNTREWAEWCRQQFIEAETVADDAVTSAAIADNAVTNPKLRDSVGLSVIGRSVNTTGDPGDITAANDGEVLRRSGATIGFGSIASSAVTESTNLFFTDERAQDAVGTILTDTATIDVTYSDATPSITIDVKLAANFAWTGTHTWSVALAGPNGTAGTPTFGFTSNAGLGTYRAAADTLGFATNSALAGQVNSSKQWRLGGGNQGSLEAATASTKIVASNASAAYIEAYDGTRSAFIGADAGGVEMGAFSNHALNLRTNNTDRVTIDTSGNVAVNAGNLTLATAGNKMLIKEGSNASMGVVTLVAGAATATTSIVTANSRIFLTGQNSSGTHGELTVSSRSAGASFVVTSSSATDTRLVAWHILEPA